MRQVTEDVVRLVLTVGREAQRILLRSNCIGTDFQFLPDLFPLRSAFLQFMCATDPALA